MIHLALNPEAVKKDFEITFLERLLTRIEPLGYPKPTSVIPTERPDFVLTSSAGDVGVEVTAAIYSEYVRANRLHHERLSDSCIDTTHLKDREPRRSNGEILKEISSFGNEWQDVAEGMCDWCDKIALAINRKRENLETKGYQLFSQNWLLICDQPGLDNDFMTLNLASRHLTVLFSSLTPQAIDFDSIFLLSDPFLFHWSKKKLDLHLPQSS